MRSWHEGGKEEFLGRFDMTMTHDELAAKLGTAYEQMRAAGFGSQELAR